MKKEGEEQHNLMNGFITLVSYLRSPGAPSKTDAAINENKPQMHADKRRFDNINIIFIKLRRTICPHATTKRKITGAIKKRWNTDATDDADAHGFFFHDATFIQYLL